jgi:hypothetical protein
MNQRQEIKMALDELLRKEKSTMASDKDKSNDQEYFVEFTPAVNKLQSKAPLIDKNLDSVLRQADGLITESQTDYQDWIHDYIASIEEAFDILSADPRSEQANRAIFEISYSMIGLGGTFDYPLITFVMQNLCKFLNNRDQLNKQDLQIARVHINAIKQILSLKTSGDGGENGKDIMRGLVKIIERDT